MKPQITITFASTEDFETARRQIDKARSYSYRGTHLGALGLALLLTTLERAVDVTATTTNKAAKKTP